MLVAVVPAADLVVELVEGQLDLDVVLPALVFLEVLVAPLEGLVDLLLLIHWVLAGLDQAPVLVQDSPFDQSDYFSW